MKKPTLLILAAGMGSRYGGLKQMDKLGPSGEAIIDYSIYDAIRAGFGKVCFIVRESFIDTFKNIFEPKLKGRIKTEYITQEIFKVPEGVKINTERQKPWGTAHAVLMAAENINEPFAVINADDFYGAQAFKTLADYFNTSNQDNEYSMVSYFLKNTLSDFGYVSRGVCDFDADNFLTDVVERTRIEKDNDKIFYINQNNEKVFLGGDELVSMNFWGFKPAVFKYFKEYFIDFIKENNNNLKSEYFIPLVINNLIKSNISKVKVLNCDAKWFGVTYKEDKQTTINKIAELVKSGVYPEDLWA